MNHKYYGRREYIIVKFTEGTLRSSNGNQFFLPHKKSGIDVLKRVRWPLSPVKSQEQDPHSLGFRASNFIYLIIFVGILQINNLV